jgi:CBS-domain-containing membrane protein
MEGHTEPDRPDEPDTIVDLDRNELLMLLNDVQDTGLRKTTVDLDRRDLLSTLRDVQDEPSRRRAATTEDDNFLWLG